MTISRSARGPVDVLSFPGTINAATTAAVARAAGGDVVLLHLTPEVRSVVELTRLHRVFEIFDDVDAAIAKLSR